MRTKIGDVFYLKWEDDVSVIFEGIVKREDEEFVEVIKHFNGYFAGRSNYLTFTESEYTGGNWIIKYPNENPEYFI